MRVKRIYKLCIKRRKHDYFEKCSKVMALKLAIKSSKEFWKGWHNICGKSNSQQNLPCLESNEEVCEKFNNMFAKNFVNSWSGPLYNKYCNIEKEILSKYSISKHAVFSRNDVSLAISKLKIEKYAGLDKFTAENI